MCYRYSFTSYSTILDHSCPWCLFHLLGCCPFLSLNRRFVMISLCHCLLPSTKMSNFFCNFKMSHYHHSKNFLDSRSFVLLPFTKLSFIKPEEHPVRIKLTNNSLLNKLVNHYILWCVHVKKLFWNQHHFYYWLISLFTPALHQDVKKGQFLIKVIAAFRVFLNRAKELFMPFLTKGISVKWNTNSLVQDFELGLSIPFSVRTIALNTLLIVGLIMLASLVEYKVTVFPSWQPFISTL